jgi:hypothetical protein
MALHSKTSNPEYPQTPPTPTTLTIYERNTYIYSVKKLTELEVVRLVGGVDEVVYEVFGVEGFVVP